jgi:hypothetical protein
MLTHDFRYRNRRGHFFDFRWNVRASVKAKLIPDFGHSFPWIVDTLIRAQAQFNVPQDKWLPGTKAYFESGAVVDHDSEPILPHGGSMEFLYEDGCWCGAGRPKGRGTRVKLEEPGALAASVGQPRFGEAGGPRVVLRADERLHHAVRPEGGTRKAVRVVQLPDWRQGAEGVDAGHDGPDRGDTSLVHCQ